MRLERLVTYATMRELTYNACSVALRHVAQLDDGREILLLDDRGFGLSAFNVGETTGQAVLVLAREQLEGDARACVGPDEPGDQRDREGSEAAHWAFIVERLRAAGVNAAVDDVRRLRHDVVLDEGLRAAVV